MLAGVRGPAVAHANVESTRRAGGGFNMVLQCEVGGMTSKTTI